MPMTVKIGDTITPIVEYGCPLKASPKKEAHQSKQPVVTKILWVVGFVTQSCQFTLYCVAKIIAANSNIHARFSLQTRQNLRFLLLEKLCSCLEKEFAKPEKPFT